MQQIRGPSPNSWIIHPGDVTMSTTHYQIIFFKTYRGGNLKRHAMANLYARRQTLSPTHKLLPRARVTRRNLLPASVMVLYDCKTDPKDSPHFLRFSLPLLTVG